MCFFATSFACAGLVTLIFFYEHKSVHRKLQQVKEGMTEEQVDTIFMNSKALRIYKLGDAVISMEKPTNNQKVLGFSKTWGDYWTTGYANVIFDAEGKVESTSYFKANTLESLRHFVGF